MSSGFGFSNNLIKRVMFIGIGVSMFLGFVMAFVPFILKLIIIGGVIAGCYFVDKRI